MILRRTGLLLSSPFPLARCNVSKSRLTTNVAERGFIISLSSRGFQVRKKRKLPMAMVRMKSSVTQFENDARIRNSNTEKKRTPLLAFMYVSLAVRAPGQPRSSTLHSIVIFLSARNDQYCCSDVPVIVSCTREQKKVREKRFQI